MKNRLLIAGPCIILPPLCLVLLSYPSVKRDIETRLPLLSAYYVAAAFSAEVRQAEKRQGEGIPPAYASILADYEKVLENQEFIALRSLSASDRDLGLAAGIVAGFVLRVRNLPGDFLSADPVKRLAEELASVRERERVAARLRDELLRAQALHCLKYRAPRSDRAMFPRGLPPQVTQNGLVFCGERIPLERQDIRKRIEYQILFLLTDFRETTCTWLKRKDRYGEAMETILEKEGLPDEFCLLPALESGYNRTALSPSAAGGWWQFVKPTAVRSHARNSELDWSLQVDEWRDERRDLALSTRSAARLLKWMRSRIGGKSWLTAAAAYNAGVTEIRYRCAAYGTDVYWDMKLSLETEQYVPRWIALCVIDANRKYYGIDVPPITPLRFDTLEGIQLAKDLPLSVLATVCESSVRFIREINGGIPKDQHSFKAAKNNRELCHTIHVPRGWKSTVLRVLQSGAYLKNGV
jgi:membrane-bound lytic murein transglycosylase D